MSKPKRRSMASELKGAARRAHFANGGDIAGWRGRARTMPDQKKQASKNACRGRAR